jgi:hypothetical protein
MHGTIPRSVSDPHLFHANPDPGLFITSFGDVNYVYQHFFPIFYSTGTGGDYMFLSTNKKLKNTEICVKIEYPGSGPDPGVKFYADLRGSGSETLLPR